MEVSPHVLPEGPTRNVLYLPLKPSPLLALFPQAQDTALPLDHNSNESPLHYSAHRGDEAMLRLFLERGVDPNTQDLPMERSPLHCAVNSESYECVKLLMKFQADPDLKDSSGNTAFDLASGRIKELLNEFEGRRSMITIIEEEEPECERASSKKNRLFEYLAEMKLETYFYLLVNAGFDHLDSLHDQMKTPFPITPQVLQRIGISKPGHCKRIVMRLRDLNSEFSDAESGFLEWLRGMKLTHLYGRFVDSGYDDLGFMKELMESQDPITDSVLKYEIGIDKPGYRIRILGRLMNEVRKETISQSGCGLCSVF